eukprot:Amastigsp_a175578_46.p4 type:complete len:114 gc:universal Amastigsp_a175578_46:933-592(-)
MDSGVSGVARSCANLSAPAAACSSQITKIAEPFAGFANLDPTNEPLDLPCAKRGVLAEPPMRPSALTIAAAVCTVRTSSLYAPVATKSSAPSSTASGRDLASSSIFRVGPPSS